MVLALPPVIQRKLREIILILKSVLKGSPPCFLEQRMLRGPILPATIYWASIKCQGFTSILPYLFTNPAVQQRRLRCSQGKEPAMSLTEGQSWIWDQSQFFFQYSTGEDLCSFQCTTNHIQHSQFITMKLDFSSPHAFLLSKLSMIFWAPERAQ